MIDNIVQNFQLIMFFNLANQATAQEDYSEQKSIFFNTQVVARTGKLQVFASLNTTEQNKVTS